MRTIERTLFKFEELNEEQKERALNDHRHWNVENFEWWDCTFEDAKTIAGLMGIEIKDIFFSGFWSQGDGACFTGSFSYNKGMVKKVKEYAPKDERLHRIAEDIFDLHRRAFYSTYGRISHTGRYCHERSMSVEHYQERGEDIHWKLWEDVFADFALWIYRRLEEEYEYLTSDEAVEESLIANEYEFEVDEEGELV